MQLITRYNRFIFLSTVWIQAFMLALLCVTASAQKCDYQQQVCVCSPGEDVCYFKLVVEQLLSLTSYKLVRSSDGNYVRQVNAPSATYFLNANGQLQPRNTTVDPSRCQIFGEGFSAINCSLPMIIDSVTEGTFYATNGLVPGPTIVVNYNQTVSIEVSNRLINEQLTIHWHGMHQNSTPWMDGVSHITQCPTNTYTSFHYIFKAIPSGTMWYHSHVGTQRTEGLYGSLIVNEPQDVFDAAEIQLQELLGETFSIVDEAQHTLSFLDWQREDIIEVTLKTLSDNPYFETNVNEQFESIAFGTAIRFDGAEVSRIPYWAGLINGLGRPMQISYASSRLTILNVGYRDVNNPEYYRFRLVGAQNRYMFRFSISEHKLIVIATDGYLTEPMEVDYIFIHTGERYDFLLKPKTEAETGGKNNFLILAETVQVNTTNIAEAFLHYGDESGDPPSTEYEQIVNDTVPRDCSSTSPCKALNCPFRQYPPGTFIDCIPVTSLQLLFPTEDEIPSNDVQSENTHFFDFSFIGSAESAAVNGRNFVIPTGSLQTDPEQEMRENICELGTVKCTDDQSPDQCVCTHLIALTDQFATIQFVITAIGDGGVTSHPIHIHGHSFQVAGIYYGEYDDNGMLVATNPNVTCRGDPSCTNPGWTTVPMQGSVSRKTVRKDTIVVPAKGYVVVRFLADNWGYWYMHCHIEPHFIEGMAVVINELVSLSNPPPEQQSMLKCGNFNWTVEEFNEQLGGGGGGGGGATGLVGSSSLLALSLATVLVASLVNY